MRGCLGRDFVRKQSKDHARIQKVFSGGVQIPRRGLTKNFNMAKINNLAISGGVRTPCPPPPLDPPMRMPSVFAISSL